MSTENIDRNISIIYLKKDLSFEKLIPNIKDHILKNYKCNAKERMDLVANVKNIFDNVYKHGYTIYSGTHGNKETEILRSALQPFLIKTAQVNSDEDGAIMVLSDKDINCISEMNKVGEEFFVKKMFEDIESFLNERFKNR